MHSQHFVAFIAPCDGFNDASLCQHFLVPAGQLPPERTDFEMGTSFATKQLKVLDMPFEAAAFRLTHSEGDLRVINTIMPRLVGAELLPIEVLVPVHGRDDDHGSVKG